MVPQGEHLSLYPYYFHTKNSFLKCRFDNFQFREKSKVKLLFLETVEIKMFYKFTLAEHARRDEFQ